MRNRKIEISLIIALFLFSAIPALAGEFKNKDPQPKSQGKEKISESKKDSSSSKISSQGSSPQSGSSSKMLFQDKAFESVEKLNVDPVTGTATMSIPISVPAGRSGMKPEINLLYNSGMPNSALGFGWSFELGKISRSTKYGVPKYNSSDEFILVQSGSRQELVDISGNATEFRSKFEGSFMKMEFINNMYWLVTDKKGVKYYFGQTESSQVVDSGNLAKIFEWNLDYIEDIYGNYMTITYTKDQNQLYPNEIKYTGNIQSSLPTFATVQFELENRPDTLFSYRSHFFLGTQKRISTIQIFVEGDIQKKYQISYTQSLATQRSLLSSITQFGDDGTTSVPATSFSYTEGQKGFDTVTTGWNIPSEALFGEIHPTYGGGDIDLGVRITDLNGDGYPDIIKRHEYEDAMGGSTFSEHTFLHDKNQSWVESSTDWVPPSTLSSIINSTIPGNIIGGHVFRDNNSNGVSIVDVDGDFRPDIMRHFQDIPANGGGVIHNEAYINNQINGWALNSDWVLSNDGVLPMAWKKTPSQSKLICYYPYHEHTGNVLDDVNGDGYVDYIKSKSNGFGPHTHMTFISNLPDATGWTYDSSWNTDNNTYTDFAYGAILIDLNGDGLKDIMYSKDSTVKVYMNNGLGWVEDSTSVWKNEFGYTNFNDGTTQCADVNGDGTIDLIVSDATTHKILLNTAQGWVVDLDWNVPGNLKNNGTKLMDIDADGMLDAVKYFTSGTTPEFHVNKGEVPDLLKAMDNGIGGVRTIEYDSACHYGNTFFPFSSQVVKSMTMSDSLGQSYEIQYSYADGYWDASKRESRGFGYVKIIDADGNYTETYTLQDDIYKGRTEKQESYDASGNLLSKIENVWNHEQVSSGVNFVYLEEKNSFFYGGSVNGKRGKEKYFYEESPQFGNVTKTINYGKVDLSTGDDIGTDSKTAEIEYHNNIANGNRLIGLPKQSIAKDHSGVMIKKTSIYYDGATNPNTLPTVGHATKKQVWGGDSPGDQDVITKYTYDDYGNVLSVEDPMGNVSFVEYETNYYIFSMKSQNALGHEVVKEYYGVDGVPLDDGAGYHGLWGQIKQIEDPNNQEGRKTYDTLGRLVATVSPLDSIDFPTSSVEYNFFPTHVQIISHHREKAGQLESIDTVQYYDGLGRLIQNKSESGYASTFTVSGQTEYDQRGLSIKKYLPYFSINPVDVIDPIDSTRPFVEIDYDAMGRAVQTTNPDGSYSSVLYDGWTTTSIDENGHKQVSYADVFGRLIKKEEYFGADGRSEHYSQNAYILFSTTLYGYDSMGNLIEIQDAHGNITTISYDILGRKISMDDPDMGIWEYDYDINGNLILQKDALSQEIEFEYDALNRLIRKKDQSNLDVSYYYDEELVVEQADVFLLPNIKSPLERNGELEDGLMINDPNSFSVSAEPNYGIGRLTKAEDNQEGETDFSYDIMGREYKSVKQIDSVNYRVRRNYDSANRLKELTYPTQDKIGYDYNDAGQIISVFSIVSSLPDYFYVQNVLYNASGQMTEIQYGNGNVTTHSYDSVTLRLNQILTVDSAGQTIQDLNYMYDSAGNILAIIDNVHTSTQGFVYDELNRLVEAQGSYGVKTYIYDEVGNILQKDGLTFTYGENGAGPHAVTSLSDGTTFSYDVNGNMTQKVDADLTHWNYVYDVENHLVTVNKNYALAAKFQYDGDGGRVKRTYYSGWAAIDELSNVDADVFDLEKYQPNNKNVSISVSVPTAPQVTKYIGSLYEEQSGNSVSYIYLGSQRIAQIRNGDVMYYLADHLGGTNLLADDAGAVKELCEYKPFGSFSVHEKYGTTSQTAWFYFTGKEFDEKIGLYYYGARYYNPVIGRFITADSIVQNPGGDPQTLNRYSYCGNNPITRIDPTGHSWFKKWFSKAIAFFASAVAFVATMGNPGAAAAVFATFNITDTIVGGIQALASGASPGMILGSIGLSIGLGMIVPGISSSNLFLQVGGNAIRGAGISAATAAAMSGGRGNLGEAAAWGGAAGGLSGFLTSEQYSNLEWGDGFKDDATINAEDALVAKLDEMRIGQDLQLEPEGHSVFTIRGRSLETSDSNLGSLARSVVGKRHFSGELDVGNFTELQTYAATDGTSRNGFLTGNLSEISKATQNSLGSSDAVISRTMVHGSKLMRAARTWQLRHYGQKYSIGPFDCRGYTNYLRRRSSVY